MRLATMSASVTCAATTTVAYSTVFPRACRNTGSSASVPKFATPMKLPPVTRASWSARTSPCATGRSVKTTNSENVGRTKRYDQPCRRSAALKLFVRFVQQPLRGRCHLVQRLLRRFLALERRIARRPHVLLIDLRPGAHIRQHVRERTHLRDLGLRRVVVTVDAGRRGATGRREPVLDRRRLLLEVRADVGAGEVLGELMRRGLLVCVLLLAHCNETDATPRRLIALGLREVRDVPVLAELPVLIGVEHVDHRARALEDRDVAAQEARLCVVGVEREEVRRHDLGLRQRDPLLEA